MYIRNNFPSAFDSYKPHDQKVYGCICISPNNRILLVKGKASHMWSFPKGHRERIDKTALDCALRELKEETGISLHRDYMATKRFKAAEYYIYDVEEEYRTFIQDTNEIEDADWFTYEQICELKKNIDVSLFCQHIQHKILPMLNEDEVTVLPNGKPSDLVFNEDEVIALSKRERSDLVFNEDEVTVIS